MKLPQIKLPAELSRLFAAAVVFLLVFSNATSPLFEYHYTFDASFFMLMGRGINAGKLLYTDYCDVKGPVFYFLQALGQLVCPGRGGVFLLQLIAILATIYILYRLCILLGTKTGGRILVYAAFFILYGVNLWEGNSLEELLLPLNLLCLYLGCSFLTGEKRKLRYAFIFGLCGGCFALSKITAGVCVWGMTLALIVFLCVKKDWSFLIRSALMFLAGFAVIALPVILYFQLRGGLANMLHWCFELAFRRGMDGSYSSSGGEITLLVWELMLIPCYLGLYIALRLYKEWEKKKEGSVDVWVFMLMPLSLICMFALHTGSSFAYYLISLMPLFMLELLWLIKGWESFLSAKEEDKSAVRRGFYRLIIPSCLAFAVLSIFLVKLLPEAVQEVSLLNDTADYSMRVAMEDVMELVPEDERDDIICVDMGVRFFEFNDLLPVNKCPYNTTYFGLRDPALMEEFVASVKSGEHKWIFFESVPGTVDPSLFDFLEQEYTDVSRYEYLCLYARNE